MELLPFVIADKEKCTGCRVCEIACYSYHCGAGKIAGTVTGPVIPKLYVQRKNGRILPVQCRQCEGAPCARACAAQAIRFYLRQVVIDTARCNHCRDCAEACPFGAISLAPPDREETCANWPQGQGRLVGHKCDLCLSREQGPACVAACPEQALSLIDPRQERRNKLRQAVEASQYLYRNR